MNQTRLGTGPHVRVPDNGQEHRQPYGHGVCGDGRVDVKEEERCPAERVALVRREAGCLGRGNDGTPAVELDGERHIDDHRQQVGDGERRQDAVGGA